MMKPKVLEYLQDRHTRDVLQQHNKRRWKVERKDHCPGLIMDAIHNALAVRAAKNITGLSTNLKEWGKVANVKGKFTKKKSNQRAMV